MIVGLAALQHSIAMRVSVDAPCPFPEALNAVRRSFNDRYNDPVGSTAADILHTADVIYVEAVDHIRKGMETSRWTLPPDQD